MIKTGILGGSFNPIHIGHIALAHYLRQTVPLDEVWLIVSPQNPLKPATGLLDDRLRLRLVREALKGEDGLEASDYEYRLPRPSYTWTTLRHLSNDYPDREFVLLIGGDNWAHFEHWHRWKDILRHYRVAVYPRHDTTGTVDAHLIDISSTEIRRRIGSGQSVRGLVPQAIEQDVIRYYA